MALDSERVSAAFVARKSARGSRSCDWSYSRCNRDTPGSTLRIFTNGETIWSYGKHFPLAFWSVDGSVLVTNERYQVGEWKSGKPKYSTVTKRHVEDVQSALLVAGFLPTSDVTTVPVSWRGAYEMLHAEHAFTVWRKSN